METLTPENTVKGKRDRAILAVLLYHALRRDELCKLKVKDVTNRRGVPHLRVTGKGQKKKKIRFVVLNAHGQRLISEYLDAADHGEDLEGPLFRPVKNNASKKNRGDLRKALDGTAIYKIVKYTTGKRSASLMMSKASLPTHSELPPRPMRSKISQTSHKCNSGWVMPMCPPRASTTNDNPDLKIARPWQ